MYGILRFGVVSTPEIAQFPLGDLAFNVHTPHFTRSFAIVKTLWRMCKIASRQSDKLDI